LPISDITIPSDVTENFEGLPNIDLQLSFDVACAIAKLVKMSRAVPSEY
jgi:hypothetical protein